MLTGSIFLAESAGNLSVLAELGFSLNCSILSSLFCRSCSSHPHTRMARITSLVFVDSTISDQQIVNQIINQIIPPEADMIVLDASRDGIEQMTEVLADRSGIQSLCIVSQGSVSSLKLGSGYLTMFNLDCYGWQLQGWGEAFASDASIVLCGCAAGEQDKLFLQRLSLLTGAVAIRCLSSANLSSTQNLQVS